MVTLATHPSSTPMGLILVGVEARADLAHPVGGVAVWDLVPENTRARSSLTTS